MLGPGWETLNGWKLLDRAREYERAAGFARTLARYMDGRHATAGEALEAYGVRKEIGNMILRTCA